MTRTKLNAMIRRALTFAVVVLHRNPPEWAYWTRRDWLVELSKDTNRVLYLVARRLGWDYFSAGYLLLLTLDNAKVDSSGNLSGQTYAAKWLFGDEENDETGTRDCPAHAHPFKTETIVMENGQEFRITSYGYLPPAEIYLLRNRFPNPEDRVVELEKLLRRTTGFLFVDGKRYELAYGNILLVKRAGTRVQFPAGFFHRFGVLPARTVNGSNVIAPPPGNFLYEESMANDDGAADRVGDNEFAVSLARFSPILEDLSDPDDAIPLANELMELLGISWKDLDSYIEQESLA